MKTIYIFLIGILVSITSCKQQLKSRLSTDLTENENIVLTGEYMGQTLPYTTTKVFAPGIISNGLVNRDITFSPAGDEMYFTFATSNYSYATILSTTLKNGVWTKPEVASFAKVPYYVTIEPCLSYDGNLLYFASNRPVNDSTETKDENIWVVKRDGNNWGEPRLLDSTINTSRGEFYPSVTKNGTLYFTRDEPSGVHNIYKSDFFDGKFKKPEKLPKQINCGRNRFNAYVSPDEKFIIIPAIGVEKDVAGVNYYITFNTNSNWSEPINMGQTVNKDLGRGWSASLSPDGEYLFFMSSRGLSEKSQPTSLSYEFFQTLQTSPQNGNADIYWVKANFIDSLKVKVNREN